MCFTDSVFTFPIQKPIFGSLEKYKCKATLLGLENLGKKLGTEPISIRRVSEGYRQSRDIREFFALLTEFFSYSVRPTVIPIPSVSIWV